ncbi:hypothetical protein TNCV_1537981 [Trichonephila clavipes]|nr:hypothetical protein TNCV_1537981 [Trichonephila clavipes]
MIAATSSDESSPFFLKLCHLLKRRVPLRHRDTLNNHRAASLLVRLVKGEERWEAPDHPQRVLPHNWSGMKPNNTITCLVLKAKTTIGVKLATCRR